MTGTAAGTVRTYREALQAAASAATLLTLAVGIVIWATGGFRPQTQVDVQQLTQQVQQLTQGVGTEQHAIEVLSEKVDALPRIGDYAALGTHLEQLSTQLAALGERLTQDEIHFATVQEAVRRLSDGTGVAVRQPR